MGIFKEKRHSNNGKDRYYTDCLQTFHRVIGIGIVKTEKLANMDAWVVSGLMNDQTVINDLKNDPMQYRSVIICRSIQCGMVFANLFSKDLSLIGNKKYLEQVIRNPESYSDKVLADVLHMSPEVFFLGFCGEIYQFWSNIEHDSLSDTERLSEGGRAAYQLGISMVLNEFGY